MRPIIDKATHETTHKPPLLSIFILSATALAYEVLLVRLFSIIHWQHFAFMIISIALLGYGASGSLMTIWRRRLLDRYDTVFVTNAWLFGISAIACFIAVQQLPFNALEILWDKSQWGRLLLSYLLLTLPFFFVANTIVLTMMRYEQRIALVYGIDLLGAGAGAILIMALLQISTTGVAMQALSIAGLCAGLLALARADKNWKRRMVPIFVLSLLAVLLMPKTWLDLRLSEYKGFEQTLLIKGTALQSRHLSPVSRIDVVESLQIPFRHAPGLSLQSPSGPPPQLAVFRDGDEMTAIDHVSGIHSAEYHDYMSSALPYHVHNSAKNLLVLSSASASAILQAHFHNIARIDAVEADKQLGDLITGPYAEYYGWHFLKDKVTIHNLSPRGFAASAKKYDLIVIGPPGASAGGAAGVHALSTAYDYTVEALQSYLNLLAADGILSITLWTSTPARSNLKLFATVVTALQNLGINHPQNHIAWIRSWNTATLLIKQSALTTAEIDSIRNFSASRNFDLAWLPGLHRDEINRFQVLQQPVFYLAAKSLFSGRGEQFVDHYKYDIQPATDNRPFFNHFFKWSSLQELMLLPAQAGIAMTGVGYPTLLLTLVQAAIAALVLILLPLGFIKTKKTTDVITQGSIVFYFLSIGLAFLFIEIAFIEKFTLILNQPLYAVAVALCAFLVFSGLGSLYVQLRLKAESTKLVAILLRRSVMLIGTISVLYIILLPTASHLIMAWPETTRIVSAFVIAAPLAFAMGMPFPLGLAVLQRKNPDGIPWAWGINGCASVLSAVLAILLAIEIGFNGVMFCACGLYLIAWGCFGGYRVKSN